MASEPTDEGDDTELSERPALDPLSRAVARSRIAGALFAKHEPVKLGRYQLLERVGAGAMGVVWGAWDPELDRRVAIKLVKTERASARERIVREGQALAKLSHPNVVPIYDVGVVDEQVYLVMEWVRGENLRVWATKPRSAREIATVYRAAAHGLAAAHAAGLVHRDFKPDNAMVGDDGRVRVLDFGLARGRDEESDGARAGTPMYMAPEQVEGDAVPASDQYAMGVSLREALGDKPPGWLAEIIAHATATDPTQRFSSMDDLGAALGRDPALVWRRRFVAVGVLVVASGAFAIGTLRAGDEVERCGGGAAEIAQTWNAGTEAGVAARLRGLGAYGEQLAATLPVELGSYAKQWSGAHRSACRAHDAGELTPALYTASLGCLERSRAALGAAAEVLMGAERARLPGAVVAANALPDPDRCRADAQASQIAPPPVAISARVAGVDNAVARARVLAIAIDPRAIDIAAATEREARELAYAPLVARAGLAHGLALVLQQQRMRAIPVLDAAAALALEVGDNATAVEAIAREVFAIATASSPPAIAADTTASLKLIEPIANGLVGPNGAFMRALLFNNVGTLRMSRQNRESARAWFEKAQRARPAFRDVELAAISGNLGLVEDDRARRDALFASQGDEIAAVVGADHPLTIDVRIKAAMFVENPQRASELLRNACSRYRELHPHLTEKVTQCSYELAWLAEERGDEAELRTALAAANHPKNAETRIGKGYLRLAAGDAAGAARDMLVFADELSAGQGFWSSWRSVDALIVAAIAEHRLGDRARETMLVDRALGAIAKLDGIATTTFYKRRLARLHAMRARLGGAATVHAAAAATWYRVAGGYEALVAELDALIRAGSR